MRSLTGSSFFGHWRKVLHCNTVHSCKKNSDRYNEERINTRKEDGVIVRMNQVVKVKAAESLPVGLELALVGGFMDAYTYINRGNVFATGQTGNLVLMGIRLVNRDFYGVIMALVPIVFFIMGVFAAEYLRNSMTGKRNELWQSAILLFEMLVLFITGFFASMMPNLLANALISFAASMQFCSFRNLENGPYATVFCTGNMRSCAERFYQGVTKKDKESMRSAGRYGAVIAFFLLGVILSAVLSDLFHIRTVWGACILLLIPFLSTLRK